MNPLVVVFAFLKIELPALSLRKDNAVVLTRVFRVLVLLLLWDDGVCSGVRAIEQLPRLILSQVGEGRVRGGLAASRVI